MRRCEYCRRIIWPWQRRGELMDIDTTRMFWHARCYRLDGYR